MATLISYENGKINVGEYSIAGNIEDGYTVFELLKEDGDTLYSSINLEACILWCLGKRDEFTEHWDSVMDLSEDEDEEEPSADDLDLTEDEYKELRNNTEEWNIVKNLYEKDPFCFEVFENAEKFGASDPDNSLREDEDNEEWAEFLYGAHLNNGDFVKIFLSGRYLLGVNNHSHAAVK